MAASVIELRHVMQGNLRKILVSFGLAKISIMNGTDFCRHRCLSRLLVDTTAYQHQRFLCDTNILSTFYNINTLVKYEKGGKQKVK